MHEHPPRIDRSHPAVTRPGPTSPGLLCAAQLVSILGASWPCASPGETGQGKVRRCFIVSMDRPGPLPAEITHLTRPGWRQKRKDAASLPVAVGHDEHLEAHFDSGTANGDAGLCIDQSTPATPRMHGVGFGFRCGCVGGCKCLEREQKNDSANGSLTPGVIPSRV